MKEGNEIEREIFDFPESSKGIESTRRLVAPSVVPRQSSGIRGTSAVAFSLRDTASA